MILKSFRWSEDMIQNGRQAIARYRDVRELIHFGLVTHVCASESSAGLLLTQVIACHPFGAMQLCDETIV